MALRGIRGAASARENTAEAIWEATRELLKNMLQENMISPQDLASVFFTVTPDLNAAFPAQAARELGWVEVPLLCAMEIDVPGSPPGIIRVLMHANSEKSQAEIKHVYLGEAISLRPDLAGRG